LITSLTQLAPEVIEALMEMLMSRLNRAAAQQHIPAAAAPDEVMWQARDSDRSHSPGDSSHRGWHERHTPTATTPGGATWQVSDTAWSYSSGDGGNWGWHT
jgi:hypothetical protein